MKMAMLIKPPMTNNGIETPMPALAPVETEDPLSRELYEDPAPPTPVLCPAKLVNASTPVTIPVPLGPAWSKSV